MVALVLVSSLALSLSGAALNGPSGKDGVFHTSLPVVSCPTTYSSFPAGGLPSLPVTVPIDMPTALKAAIPMLAVYTVSNGTLAVIGGRSSACAGLVAEDGSAELVVVSPTDAGNLPAYVHQQRSPSEGIVASDTGGCTLCNTQEACIVSASPKRLTPVFGFQLRCAKTRQWSIRRLNKTVAYFKTHSGQLGVAIYNPKAEGSALATGYLATCSLPKTKQVICEAMQGQPLLQG